MNVNLIKQRLATLQSRGGQNKSKRSELIWKAPIGKTQVRIIPAKWDKENPFREILFHYGIGSRTMVSLVNYGEKDPIVEFSQNLQKGPYNVDNFKLAKKLEPKMRIFAPVIVRGEEDKGVRLWEFGKEVYMELLAIAEDEDVGDYTDTYQGRDLNVETVGPDQSGRQFNKTSVRVKTKQTPASEDSVQIKNWLENQPDPLDIQTKPTYEDLKQALLDWLDPKEDAEEDADGTATAPAPSPSNFKLNVGTKPAKVDDDLDQFFKDTE